MSLTSGFYNSNDHDRRYSADQMSSLFEGVFSDGVFEDYPGEGDHFAVTPGTGNRVVVGPGRAWFNRKWVDNSDSLTISLDAIPNGVMRKDVIVLVINTSNMAAVIQREGARCTGRAASIVVVKGEEVTSNPQSPITQWPYTPTSLPGVYCYPLATINVSRGGNQVLADDITSHVGTAMCPYIRTKIKPISDAINVTVDGQTFVVVSAPPYTINFSGTSRGISANGTTGHGSHVYPSAPTVYNDFAEAIAAYDSGIPLRACWQGTPNSPTSPKVYISSYNVYTCTQPSSREQGRAIGFWYSWVHATNWDAGHRELDAFGALHITWYEDGTLIITYEKIGNPNAKASGSSDDYDYPDADPNAEPASYESVPYEGT